MPRVVHILDSLASDGAQTSYLNMVPTLLEEGIELAVMALSPHPTQLTSAFEALGVPVLVEEPGLGRLQKAAAVRRFVDRYAPDVVHTALFEADLAARLACPFGDPPILTTLANVSYGPEHFDNFQGATWKLSLAFRLDRLLSGRTAHFHAVAQHVADDMAGRLGIGPDRMTVVPRGRDGGRLGRRTAARRAQTRGRLGFDEHTPLILGIGRHSVQKALDVSIAAMTRVRQVRPDAVLLLAGREGEETERLRALAAESPEGSVVFLGYRTDVADLFSACDVLAFPSRWEGMPGALIEAMALEIPIVASDTAPNREVLPATAGAFVPLDRPDALAEGVLEALRAPPLEQTRCGREHFEANLTIQAASRGLAALYRRLA